MMKKTCMTALFATLLLGMTACSGQETGTSVPESASELVVQSQSEAPAVTESVTETQTETEKDLSLGEDEMYSYLTGEPVAKSVGLKRPYAIMINNIGESLPQSGILYAEMVYEAQVEGGITRLMGVFQDVDAVEKIGSIRSARHYYVDFANDNDALYVHFGQSSFAQDRFDREGIVTISGLSGYSASVFYRSDDREAPHNVYTTGEMLAEGARITGLSREYPEDYVPRLQFNHTETPLPGGISAVTVAIPFDCAPRFEYDSDSGLYRRFQYGEEHIDRETGRQLTFKNIIIQYVSETTISDHGHQDLTLNGTGNGYYITDGKAIPVTWERNGDSDRTVYYDENGEAIRLNPGKTFFELVPDNKEVSFE